MGFEDVFAITKIRDGRRDNLSLSIDEMDEIVAVILFTPDMENTIDHHHIELNRKRATEMRDWLNAFLSEPDLKARLETDYKRRTKELNK